MAKTKQAQIDELQETVKGLLKANEEMSQKYEEILVKADEGFANSPHRKQLETDLQFYKVGYKSQSKRIETLTKQSENQIAEIKALQEEVLALRSGEQQASVDRLEVENKQLRDELVAKRAELRNREQRFDRLLAEQEEQITKLKAKLNNQQSGRKTNKESQQLISDLQEKVSKLEQHNARGAGRKTKVSASAKEDLKQFVSSSLAAGSKVTVTDVQEYLSSIGINVSHGTAHTLLKEIKSTINI